MEDYQIYHMDEAGAVVGGFDANYASDEIACQMARRFIGLYDRSEVWSGTRWVGEIVLRPATLH